MIHNMILSASGWRKVFAESNDQEDKTTEIGETNGFLCALIAETFAEYIKEKTGKAHPVIAVATDTRPTGKQIARIILRVLIHYEIEVKYTGISSAPEIMAYARQLDGFLYISASHNPVGHNGIKFGLKNGGVLPGSETMKLVEVFQNKCADENAEEHAREITRIADDEKVREMYTQSILCKDAALKAYEDFIKVVITGTKDSEEQKKVFQLLNDSLLENPLSLVCDMNGSSRILSIDKKFFAENTVNFLPFNTNAQEIPHAIIPEPENLIYCANQMEYLRNKGQLDVQLGYMPDCDGDRGNIVYWNEKKNKALPIPAQEVFALSVLSECAYNYWLEEKNSTKSLFGKILKDEKQYAVVVNCPTSNRIDEIADAFDTRVFRAEVGEANVVNLAREKRDEGYTVRILGEGSNGGNITSPSSVRDPLATVYALIKLLSIRDTISEDGTIQKGLFHLWCEKSCQEKKYRSDFTLTDVIDTLPAYTTTGVSESRAILNIKTTDKGLLKEKIQKEFLKSWELNKEQLNEKFSFDSYEVIVTNGTAEKSISSNRSWNNGNGGLKIKFYDAYKNFLAFIWMRPSGTEPVFRVMCDVKGKRPKEEKSLLSWETMLISQADESEYKPEENT